MKKKLITAFAFLLPIVLASSADSCPCDGPPTVTIKDCCDPNNPPTQACGPWRETSFINGCGSVECPDFRQSCKKVTEDQSGVIIIVDCGPGPTCNNPCAQVGVPIMSHTNSSVCRCIAD